MTNKTEKDIEQAISELKAGSIPAKNSKPSASKEKAAAAAKQVREVIEKNGSDALVVNPDGSADAQKKPTSKSKSASAGKIAKNMKARVAGARGRGRPSLISEAEFKNLWQGAASMQDLVEKLAANPAFANKERTEIKLHCSGRASQLRKKGTDLKLFPRGRKTIK